MEDFYIVLLSNSSMKYYPKNKTTCFVTKLPRHVELIGKWLVALVEIQIPLTFQHVPASHDQRKIDLITDTDDKKNLLLDRIYVEKGLYNNLLALIAQVNILCFEHQLVFDLKPNNYVQVWKHCLERRALEMGPALKKILGINYEKDMIEINDKVVVIGDFPANLCNALPTNLLVYTDICEPYMTGDVSTKLLRNISLNLDQYSYGSIVSRTFSSPVYIPVLCQTFETIEIDIRDQYGKSVPFDFGTSTLTLHFKRVD